MISEARYKTVYAVYSFIVSLLILGLLYINHSRLLSSHPFDFDWVHRINLVEVGIPSVIAVVVCSIIMYAKQLHFALWKIFYGAISAGIIFIIEFIMVADSQHMSTRDLVMTERLAVACRPVFCFVLGGLVIYGCVLKAYSDINILSDEDGEIVSAIFIANIAVMLATVLAYVLLLCLS